MNVKKCSFLKNSVKVLEHIVSKEGVAPNKEKVEVIQKINIPTTVTKVKSFLGVLNFYQ